MAGATRAQRDIEARSLKILCVTYNMAGKLFRTRDSKKDRGLQQLDDLFQKDNAPHDVYVFGTQEAERGIAGSLFNEDKAQLLHGLKTYFRIKSY